MDAAPQGPQCQSCGMPMARPENFGTNADGSRNEDYCAYCFQAGELTAPNMTLEQMASEVIPKLKRWQSA